MISDGKNTRSALKALATVVLSVLTTVGHANLAASQEGRGPLYDFDISYHARDTANAGTIDDDILRLRFGISQWDPENGNLLRLVLFAGLHDVGINLGNNSHGTDLDANEVGIETLWLRGSTHARSGLGLRLAHVSVAETGLELMALHERFIGRIDLRFMGGLQALSDDVTGRSKTEGAFGLIEASYWLHDDLALRAGVSGDNDGTLASIGIERAVGRHGASLYLDWGYSLGGYRDLDDYDALSAGLRIPLGSKSQTAEDLRTQQRITGTRSLFRPVDLQ